MFQKSLWLMLFVSATAMSQEVPSSTYSDPSSEGFNTFVGRNSGNSYMSPAGGPVNWASWNTALGENSFALNQTGFENTAVGTDALYANISGNGNTAVGAISLPSNTTGRSNTSIGFAAMYRSQTGIHNTAVGVQSLYMNTSGSENVAIGRDANFSNTTGRWNTGVGVDAIPGVETGSGNTGVGGESGYTENLLNQNVTGSNNTWVGYQSGPSSPAQHSGVIGVGYRAKTSKDNQAVIGTPQIVETLLYGKVGINTNNPAATLVVNGDATNLTGAWGVFSDVRLKKDIEPYKDGLEVVVRLRPVSYKYNGLEGLDPTKTQVGLIAQEVEVLVPGMVSTHDGVDLEQVKMMSTQALPYILVNAIQQLNERVEQLEAQLKNKN
jgi:hypothetical protein